MVKKILYVGSRDKELIEQIQTAFVFTEDVVVSVLDKPDLNFMDDRSKQKIIDWKESESISQYIRNPSNVTAAIDKSTKLFEMIKELKAIERFAELMEATGKDMDEIGNQQMEAIKAEANGHWTGWFTLKDVVEATTLSYAHAREHIDLLYAFGFLAIKDFKTTKLYTFLLDDAMKIEYLTLLIQENEDNNKLMKAAIKSIKGNKPKKAVVSPVIEKARV